MKLYRPVGLWELKLVYETGLRAFPPRLPEQPIFYPVLNLAYAQQIAHDWNATNEPFAGYVLQFAVEDAYGQQFERHIVGNRQHEEWWVPAERLTEFNQHIVGLIEVVDAYFGLQFRGYIADKFGFKSRDAIAQFVMLGRMFSFSTMDFQAEIAANNMAVFLHYPFWEQRDFSDDGLNDQQRDTVLSAIQIVWSNAFPDTPLLVFHNARV